jgi:hypothetical protein
MVVQVRINLANYFRAKRSVRGRLDIATRLLAAQRLDEGQTSLENSISPS